MLTQSRPAPADIPNPGKLVGGYDRVIFLMVIGLVMLGFGVYNVGNLRFNWFFIAFGVAFLIFGISQFNATRRIRAELHTKG